MGGPGDLHPRFGQGLEVCRLQLGPRGRRRDIEDRDPIFSSAFLQRYLEEGDLAYGNLT